VTDAEYDDADADDENAEGENEQDEEDEEEDDEGGSSTVAARVRDKSCNTIGTATDAS
jgi:hypothetical protein